MTPKEYRSCHDRWWRALPAKPASFPDNHRVHRLYKDGHQCGGCAFYLALEGSLGMDWGVCGNPKSAHDASVVFEHHSCWHISERPESGGLRCCPACHGTGEARCAICHGRGEVIELKRKKRRNENG